MEQATEILGLLRANSEMLQRIEADLDLVRDQQRLLAQHMGNLESRYATLDCVRPRTPSEGLKAVKFDKGHGE